MRRPRTPSCGSFYQVGAADDRQQAGGQQLRDQIFGIPDQRTTKINADVQAAQNAINNTQTLIDNLHGKTVTDHHHRDRHRGGDPR
jgi:hypothetical protein